MTSEAAACGHPDPPGARAGPATCWRSGRR